LKLAKEANGFLITVCYTHYVSEGDSHPAATACYDRPINPFLDISYALQAAEKQQQSKMKALTPCKGLQYKKNTTIIKTSE